MGDVVQFLAASSPISSENHTAAVNATATAGALVNACCTSILQQENLVVPSMPGIATHQQTARDHANNWINTVQPTLIAAIHGIVAFGNQFDAFMTPLLAAAAKVATDPTAKNTVVTGLTLLKNNATTHMKTATNSTNAVAGFRENFSSDFSSFQSDLSAVQTQLTADSPDTGSIAQLTKKCEADQTAMSKDLAMIAGGATGMVVGGLMIAVGALAEIETAGASTALILAGGVMVAGGAVMTGMAGSHYHNLLNDYHDDMVKLAAAKAELTLLIHVKGQLTALDEQIDPAVKALNSLQASWQLLGTEFQTLLGQVNGTDINGPFLQQQLVAAQTDWSDLATQAAKVQSMIQPPQIPLSMVLNAA
ncbi:MAG TPA: HBL/NHE enterotoxin family protein [Allosphingosinicella sp.]|jgi:non-hemolytic enterotoxin B/C